MLVCTVQGDMLLCKKTKAHMFAFEEIWKLLPGGKPYKWLCTTLIPCVVGWKAWKRKKYREPLSDIATCSGESFVLLTLENNYDRWMHKADWLASNKDKEPHEQQPKNFPDAKYTNSGKSKQKGHLK